ncbi:hypothetical protein SCA6_012287 [Theobroma cacao]
MQKHSFYTYYYEFAKPFSLIFELGEIALLQSCFPGKQTVQRAIFPFVFKVKTRHAKWINAPFPQVLSINNSSSVSIIWGLPEL